MLSWILGLAVLCLMVSLAIAVTIAVNLACENAGLRRRLRGWRSLTIPPWVAVLPRRSSLRVVRSGAGRPLTEGRR
jgi:hypothetical protein